MRSLSLSLSLICGHTQLLLVLLLWGKLHMPTYMVKLKMD
jgi:hypothetical protein